MNWQILYKYIEGKCDEEELYRIGEWLQENPANEDFFTTFIEECSDEQGIEAESDARAAWEEFKNRKAVPNAEKTYSNSLSLIDKLSEKSSHLNKRNRKRNIIAWSYAIAAIILIAGTMFYINQNIMGPAKKTAMYQEISTTQGQRIDLQLSDSTKVVLNANSRLQIPEGYGHETRTIRLEGEAFFEVKHNEDLPFIVISNNAYAKDLGTKFNISAYDSSGIEVAVEEGLVSMGRVKDGNPQKDIVELEPHKLGTLKNVEGLRVSDIKHMDQFMGWVKGKLVFRSTPLPEVVNRLERWYDINCKVEVSNPEERTLTATYDNMSVNEVLKVLSVSMNISYTQKGRMFIFR